MRSIYLPTRSFLSLVVWFLCTPTSSSAQKNSLFAQGSFHKDVFNLSPNDSTFSLKYEFVIPATQDVMLDSVHLVSGDDYELDSRFGLLRLHSSVTKPRLQKKDSVHTLTVRYQALPFAFKRSYSHRVPWFRADSVGGERAHQPAARFSFDEIFAGNLQKSGSIVRGFTVGSNRDLSLNSGVRMQMAGNLTRDIEVVAALTDENTPIQPEGTTRTLQEVDKVFVELRGNNMRATLGDFQLSLSGNEFGRINRKLQGAKGTITYRVQGVGGDVLASGAVARGKFTTNQFQGIDGVQGPYRLTGQHNERDIIVIAGTERVYVNGEQMTRGEVNDYVIDYAVGEIIFGSRRFISRVSRIIVDFEYTDRQFNRNFVAARSGTNFLDNKLTLNATFVQENDNENSPIDITLSDSDKAILRSAGNERFKAVRSGVVYVGPGKGQYLRKDTVVTIPARPDSSVTIFEYAPADTLNAAYTVTFSYVGARNGDYEKISLGQYKFNGIRQGSYLPIRFLPVPTALSLTDVELGGQLTDNFKLTGEYALSSFDANRFSSLNDDENHGFAAKFGLQYGSNDLRLGGMNFGAFDMSLKERFIDKRYSPPDRVNDIEFNRKWNINDSLKVDEELREGLIHYQPSESFSVNCGFGWIRRGDPFSSKRYTASANLLGERLSRASYDLELIKSKDKFLDADGSWTRHHGLASYSLGFLVPGLVYNGEVRRERSAVVDTLRQGSFRFNEIIPRIVLDSIANMSLQAEFGWRWDDSLAASTLQRASSSFTQTYAWQLREWKSLSSTLDTTLQKKRSTEAFVRSGDSDLQTILLRLQSRYNPLNRGIESDWLYELATERSARLERVFQQVPKGTGNYTYIGDANGNHVVDDQDFRLARFDGDFIGLTLPSENLFPVVDLKASTRLRLNGNRLFSAGSFLQRAISTLSTETYLRVDEKSSDADKKEIYLLHFSHFLSDQTTLMGSNVITQDIYLLENNPEFSCRFRYSRRRGLTQFALATERSYLSERSIRVRWQLVTEIANQTDFVEKKDILNSMQSDNRVRDILSRNLETDWSYRPQQDIQLGFKISVGFATNFDTTRADINGQSIRVVHAFSQKGQTRAELAREEVVLNRPGGGLLPFELTGGVVAGKTWLWRVGFDYRLTQFIQSMLTYDGRTEGGARVVHTAKAEVRAFF